MKKLVVIFTLIAMPFTSNAQDAIYLSGLLGLQQVDIANSNTTYDSELSYGARAGLLFNDHVSAGIYLQRVNIDSTVGIFTTESTLDNVMAEITYYFAEADENSFWVSGLLGMTFAKEEFGTQRASDDATAYGLAAGYHFMVAPNFSLSPQVTYIHSGFTNDVSEISGLVNLTFWL